MNRLLSIGIMAHLFFLGSPLLAWAGSAGIEKGITPTSFYRMTYSLQANHGYDISTFNLSEGADTVLHVQDSNGNYIAGNDDCQTLFPACTGPRSVVRIPASTSTRIVRIIVRAYNSVSTGTAVLRVTTSDVPADDRHISFGTGYVKTLPSYQATSHFLTVQERGGLNDTVLLVLSGNASRAVAYDDDNGVGFMSWVHLNESCSNHCKIIVSPYSQSLTGATTFAWDEDMHTGPNQDGDGLSTAFETVVGTNPLLKDTDGDGIDDDKELLAQDGIDWNLFLYPTYGADPLKPDVFIEADWLECPPDSDPQSTSPCGTTENPNLDAWRLSAQSALNISNYYAPEINVHIDNGIQNNDPDTWFIYGAWDGATRHSVDEARPRNNKCNWLNRPTGFHGARITGAGGGQGTLGGKCFDGSTLARIDAHELGHNFRLQHGGGAAGSGVEVNCKPNYKSIMSYANLNFEDGVVGLSRNSFQNVILNPIAVSETNAMKSRIFSKIRYLSEENPSFDHQIVTRISYIGNRAIRHYDIDWNRNGKIDSGTVRAALTWGWGEGGGCETSAYQRDGENDAKLYNHKWSTLAWIGGPNIFAMNNPTKLFWLTRRTSDGQIEYRSSSSFPDNCGSPPSADCKTNWSPSVQSDALLIEDSVGIGTPVISMNQNALLLVDVVPVTQDYGYLRYRKGIKVFDILTFDTPTQIVEAVDPGTSPAIVKYNDQQAVFTISLGILKERIYQSSGNFFGGNVIQRWSDGTPINAKYGIGVTLGWIKNGNSFEQVLMAAIPSAVPDGQIDLAWRPLAFGSRWTKGGSSIWPSGRVWTDDQPGIAYVPFDKENSPESGRFYIGWNKKTFSSGNDPGQLIQTEGNELLPATTQRLAFQKRSIDLCNVWSILTGNVSLLYDMENDENLRIAYTFDNPASTPISIFLPIGDGIFNGELRDQNDLDVVLENLATSLSNTSGN